MQSVSRYGIHEIVQNVHFMELINQENVSALDSTDVCVHFLINKIKDRVFGMNFLNNWNREIF